VTVRHAPTALAALALTGSALTWTAGPWVQARWIARYGPRRLVRLGECLVAAGLAVMCVVLLPSVPPALAIAAWALAGGGMGTAYSPLSVTTLDRAAPGEAGYPDTLLCQDILTPALAGRFRRRKGAGSTTSSTGGRGRNFYYWSSRPEQAVGDDRNAAHRRSDPRP
jgi:MFS family permease